MTAGDAQGDQPPPPQLRVLSRELATLRMRLTEDRIAGRADADAIEQLRAEITRLASDLRRAAAVQAAPPL